MKLRTKTAGVFGALALAVPGVAIAAHNGDHQPPTPAQAYGVICERPPYDAATENVEFSRCVKALAQGTNGRESARDAAKKACRQASPQLSRPEFRDCVASTKTLVLGLRAVKAR